MAGYTSSDPCHGTLLQGTSLLNCKAGIIGATAGLAYDTVLYGIYILLNATAVTMTIGGLSDNTGAAQNMLVTGFTNQDYIWFPPAPILNNFAAFTFTPSAAGKVWIFTRAYQGPEQPTSGPNTLR